MFANIEQQQKAISSLTKRQQEYINSYTKTGSPTEVVLELNLAATAKTVSNRISEIAKKLGCKSVKDLIIQDNCNADFPASSLGSKRAFAKELRKLIEKQGYKCALTGVHLTPRTAELDHITPIKKGGSNEIENLQWVSRQVNRAKGSMLQSEFIEMCRLVCENAKDTGGV